MKNLNEIQENPESHLHELRDEINKEKEYFTKEIITKNKNKSNGNSGAEELNKWKEECIRGY